MLPPTVRTTRIIQTDTNPSVDCGYCSDFIQHFPSACTLRTSWQPYYLILSVAPLWAKLGDKNQPQAASGGASVSTAVVHPVLEFCLFADCGLQFPPRQVSPASPASPASSPLFQINQCCRRGCRPATTFTAVSAKRRNSGRTAGPAQFSHYLFINLLVEQQGKAVTIRTNCIVQCS